jgi:flavin-dependent dehydrogenase
MTTPTTADVTNDVVVIGAGPAGCAAACAARAAGADVGLIADRVERRRSWAGESLPPGADTLVTAVFGDVGLTQPPHRIAYGVRGAWGSDELIDTDFLGHPRGTGWHLDRAVFDTSLRASARSAGVHVIDARASALVRTDDGWRITVDGEQRVQAKWLIDATGRHPITARRIGVGREDHDDQIGLVAVVRNERQIPATTVIESERDGWWYCTPLPGDRLVVALLTDSDIAPVAAQRMAWWHAKFTATRHVAAVVGTLSPDLDVRLTSANTSTSTSLSGDRWVAVGDAAMSWDPLSSQGLVTGILMGARAGHIVATNPTRTRNAVLSDWARDYQMLLEEHLGLRRHYWGAETRWPDSLYWSRRL